MSTRKGPEKGLGFRRRCALRIVALPRLAKSLLALGMDALLCALTVWLAMSVRLEQWVPLHGRPYLSSAGTALALALPIFAAFGLYRTILRYGGSMVLRITGRACLAYGVLFCAVLALVGVNGVPRSVGLTQPLLLWAAVSLSRVAARRWLGRPAIGPGAGGERAVTLIYGAGSAGQQLAQALAVHPEWHVAGFLDDDRRLHGGTINGLRVHGTHDMAALVRRLNVSMVLLAVPSVPRKRRNEILQALVSAQVPVRTLPGLMDLAHGRIHTSDLREPDIDDLLGRDAVAPQPELLARNTRGKVVLVTGAGGSIGSELCRQILRGEPQTVLLVESSEYALYAIHAELQQWLAVHGGPGPGARLVPLLASVREAPRMREIMRAWRPQTVYHAAAYKHVPLVEHNVAEGVKNNIFGTLVTAQVASECGVDDFVLVSTDKAVRPTNVMGTSKRVAEMALQALAAHTDGFGTCFCMVRFGNVLGSSGSVVPLFRRQIREGGPITLTHDEMTRYFMTIPEAAQLVIQAGAMASGGDVFVLDMGEPVRIGDLARRMVELSGLTVCDEHHPEGDIAIRVTGLRPGEKLYEELLIGDDPLPTQHPRIMKAHEDFLSWEELERRLARLEHALAVNDVSRIRELLRQMVHGYRPEGRVVDWVHEEQRLNGLRAA